MDAPDEAADRRMAEATALASYLPRILLYPLTGHAPGVLIMLTLFLWIGVQSVFGIALFAIAAPWLFHYAQAVIEQSANGRATPPRFGGDMLFLGTNARAFRPLLGVAAIAGAWFLVLDQGRGAQLAVLALGTFLFPAFMLVLTIENSLLAAVNPLKLAQAITGVGGAYLGVCLVLASPSAAAVYAAGAATLMLALFVSIYLWLASLHLLGYVAFHRADQLGLGVSRGAVTDEVRRMEEQQQRLATVLRELDAALQRKDLEGAARALCAAPGGPADLRLFHEELFEAMQARHKVELTHLQGARLITVLLREKRVGRALDVAETCYDAHRDFTPAQPAHAVVLAQAALAAKREGLFDRLTGDAAVRYCGDAVAVSLAFLTAKYWCELKNDDARAREILKPLLAQKAHPQHRQIQAYARAIGAA